MASELVVTRSAPSSPAPSSPAPSSAPQQRDSDRIVDVAALEAASTEVEAPDLGCVVCGAPAPEPGACCSSRCAGEAQRQLRRNAAKLHRLELRDTHGQRRRLAERNGRLMSALLRWRPESRGPCPEGFVD